MWAWGVLLIGMVIGSMQTAVYHDEHQDQLRERVVVPYDCRPAPEWSEHAYVCTE